MVGVAVAFAVAVVTGLFVRRVGPSLGYEDRPDDPELKVHTLPAVPLGGVAVFVGMHAGLVVADRFDIALLVSTSVLLLLGLADDRLGLDPKVRLAVEVIAGVILAVGILEEAGVAVAVLTALLVVVSVNAVNLFDGLDGLAGSTALLSAAGAAVFAVNRAAGAVPALIVVAALGGFLVFNWHPAKLFLGDNGAYFVGLTLVALYAFPSDGIPDIIVGTGLLGLFLVDLVSTVLRRRIAGTPMFVGDRSHIYDRIHAQGRPVPQVVLIVAVLHVAVVGAVLAADWLLAPGWAATATVAVGIAAVAIATRGAGQATKK